MKLPEPIYSLVGMIDQYHADKQGQPRGHFGCSLLGHHCDRYLWLNFRWAIQEKFDGRMLRLFRRGHMEEDTIIRDLRSVGVDIRSSQRKVNFGSHVSGSLDGVIEGGVPEAPKSRHVAEFKTHSKKSFDELIAKGVEKAKFQHFVQMQVYMHGTEIGRALYVAVCKDDDRLYTERVKYDREVAEKYIERGKRLALSDRMPEPLPGGSPEWYQCKWCPAYAMCWKEEPVKFANCRTCAHSTALPDSTWRCERHEADCIPEDFQREGCDDHIIHPHMVPWTMLEAKEENHAVWAIGDHEVLNGANGFKSREILANPSICGSKLLDQVKSVFPDVEVVG